MSLVLEEPVPVQVLFATSTSRGVVVDGLVAGSVDAPGVAGQPFSILLERGRGSGDDDAALRLLRRWSDRSCAVEASTAHDGQLLVLRSGADELVLVIS